MSRKGRGPDQDSTGRSFSARLAAYSVIIGDLFRLSRVRPDRNVRLLNAPGNENCTEKCTGRHLRAPANRGLTVVQTGRADRD